MKNRCKYDYSCNGNYKKRGIAYCSEWELFDNFYNDMGERPQGTSLDRIDPTKNYYKENCRWSTILEQALNKRVYKRIKSTLPGTRKRNSGRWSSQITINNKKIHLGTYETEQEAHERFLQERKKRQAS